VPLRLLLERARPASDVAEFVFSGADEGDIEGYGRISFQRSLPAAVATADGPLLAWTMNGEALTAEHGHPVRLVVPSWYAVASVKWLVGIDASATPFEGHFQTDRYVYRVDEQPPRPVSLMRVRALITSHGDGDRVHPGQHILAGTAWSGHAPIDRVEVQVGAHAAWRAAELLAPAVTGVATRWSCTIALSTGRHRIRVRATDAEGHTQPDAQYRNTLGYGNNVTHAIRLHVTG
jgi:DMSO/TMAO reductase YedYZ molybdopterin-dependent catalytic subunit